MENLKVTWKSEADVDQLLKQMKKNDCVDRGVLKPLLPHQKYREAPLDFGGGRSTGEPPRAQSWLHHCFKIQYFCLVIEILSFVQLSFALDILYIHGKNSVPKQMPQRYCPFSRYARYWCYLALKRREMQIALFSSYLAAIGG
jgi:hypothetical protein